MGLVFCLIWSGVSPRCKKLAPDNDPHVANEVFHCLVQFQYFDPYHGKDTSTVFNDLDRV
eukprot:COSAG01_NODE_274_length_19734_cov_122.033512_15_plen_60_part_00